MIEPRAAAVGLGLLGVLACGEAVSSPPDAAPAIEPAAGPVQHRVPSRDGHSITVWEKSPADPTDAIVLVHGRTWSGLPDFDLQVPGRDRSTMDALIRQGFATYAIDLRGYGSTPRDADGWITPDEAQADVEAVLAFVRARHGEPPVLLGWSMGALVAQSVVQADPSAVSALVLYGYPRPAEVDEQPGPPASTPPSRTRTTAQAAASDFITPQAIDRATIDAFVTRALASDPIKADWRALDEFDDLRPERIDAPTLLLHGARDPLAPVARQAELFARIAHPDRAWVVLPNSDHAAHLEDAGPRFVHAIVSFVRRPVARP